jgi:hypothetical protein
MAKWLHQRSQQSISHRYSFRECGFDAYQANAINKRNHIVGTGRNAAGRYVGWRSQYVLYTGPWAQIEWVESTTLDERLTTVWRAVLEVIGVPLPIPLFPPVWATPSVRQIILQLGIAEQALQILDIEVRDRIREASLRGALRLIEQTLNGR